MLISTHTPLTGRDKNQFSGVCLLVQFLLTRPLRDVTCPYGLYYFLWKFLLTRPLRDVTFSINIHVQIKNNFYSHAPYGT